MVTPDVPVRSAGYDADVTAASSWAAPTAQPENLTGTPGFRSAAGQQGAYPEDGR